MRSRVIVVDVDVSPAGRAALRWALEEAERTDATVQAMMVRQRRPALVAVGPPGVHPCTGRHPAHELHALVVQLRAELPGAPDTAEVTIIGDTSTALVQASRRADLLVMGSPGTEEFHGSVVAHCVRHAACPVVVVPLGVTGTSARRAKPG